MERKVLGLVEDPSRRAVFTGPVAGLRQRLQAWQQAQIAQPVIQDTSPTGPHGIKVSRPRFLRMVAGAGVALLTTAALVEQTEAQQPMPDDTPGLNGASMVRDGKLIDAKGKLLGTREPQSELHESWDEEHDGCVCKVHAKMQGITADPFKIWLYQTLDPRTNIWSNWSATRGGYDAPLDETVNVTDLGQGRETRITIAYIWFGSAQDLPGPTSRWAIWPVKDVNCPCATPTASPSTTPSNSPTTEKTVTASNTSTASATSTERPSTPTVPSTATETATQPSTASPTGSVTATGTEQVTPSPVPGTNTPGSTSTATVEQTSSATVSPSATKVEQSPSPSASPSGTSSATATRPAGTPGSTSTETVVTTPPATASTTVTAQLTPGKPGTPEKPATVTPVKPPAETPRPPAPPASPGGPTGTETPMVALPPSVTPGGTPPSLTNGAGTDFVDRRSLPEILLKNLVTDAGSQVLAEILGLSGLLKGVSTVLYVSDKVRQLKGLQGQKTVDPSNSSELDE